VSARVPVYDTGMLIALADRKAKAVALHEGLRSAPHRALVLGPVFAQVWRPRPALVHALTGVLTDCTVPQARSAESPMRETKAGRPECLACAAGPDLADWRRVATVLGQAALPAKKRPDAVDAWVALAAARHGSAVIFTSDPDDIRAYLEVLAPLDVHVVTI
jgi:predicted nucleic acid-binding protein